MSSIELTMPAAARRSSTAPKNLLAGGRAALVSMMAGRCSRPYVVGRERLWTTATSACLVISSELARTVGFSWSSTHDALRNGPVHYVYTHLPRDRLLDLDPNYSSQYFGWNSQLASIPSLCSLAMCAEIQTMSHAEEITDKFMVIRIVLLISLVQHPSCILHGFHGVMFRSTYAMVDLTGVFLLDTGLLETSISSAKSFHMGKDSMITHAQCGILRVSSTHLETDMKFCVSRPMIFRKTGPWPRSLVPYPSRILHPPPRTRATTYLVRGQRRSGAAARRRRRFSWGVMDLSALALQRVMNIDPADPILALLGEIVEELVSRTANEALRQIFPLLAYELSPHFLLELMADFPQGYCDSIGLPTIDWPLQVPLNYAISHDADRNLEEDLMNVHVAYTLYHRLARLIVLQASLPRNNAESASKASKLSDYIVTKLREVAITKVTRLLPVPIEQWLQQEIASLYARKESILLGNLSPAMKRFFINRTTFQAQDLEHLASDPCYGDKLACCNSVLAIEVFGLQETVNTLVAETTDDVLRVAFPILAFELPNELISQPISDLLPIDYVSLLGLPLLLGKPFSSRDNLNHDTWRAAECQLYTLQATYHRVGRLIILLASLAPSPENAQSSKHLKESIYSLLERCAMIFSRRFGRCMGIPRPVLQWAEKDLDDQKSSIETNGDEDDRALLLDVIQKRDRIVHHNKDYI